MATKVPSNLEIAQAHTLEPIADIAARYGLEPDEYDLYGKYKAKIDLSVVDRLAGKPDAKLVCVTAITPTKAGEGKTTTSVSLDAGAGQDRPPAGPLSPRALARTRVRDQGRRRGRRLRAGGADGGPEPPLHRRHPRDRGSQQSPRRGARGASAARQQARRRPADDRLAPLHRHERPLVAPDRDRPRRAGERLPARDGLRHHSGLRGDGDRRGCERPQRSSPQARRDHRRLHVRGRAGDSRRSQGRRRDDGDPEGDAQAEPDPDARGTGMPDALRPLREHRPRQQLARRRQGRLEAR